MSACLASLPSRCSTPPGVSTITRPSRSCPFFEIEIPGRSLAGILALRLPLCYFLRAMRLGPQDAEGDTSEHYSEDDEHDAFGHALEVWRKSVEGARPTKGRSTEGKVYPPKTLLASTIRVSPIAVPVGVSCWPGETAHPATIATMKCQDQISIEVGLAQHLAGAAATVRTKIDSELSRFKSPAHLATDGLRFGLF